jgi:predicted ester cyclase
VVTRLRMTATHRGAYVGVAATNKSIVLQACNIVEVRNGKAVRARLYADNAALLQQLGALSLPRATAAG